MRIWTAKGYREVTVGSEPLRRCHCLHEWVSIDADCRCLGRMPAQRVPNRLFGATINQDGDAV